jgi:hypothetical protein
VQDRGTFREFIGPKRPDAGRLGLSRECTAKGGWSARGDEPEGAIGFGSAYWESVESPRRGSVPGPGSQTSERGPAWRSEDATLNTILQPNDLPLVCHLSDDAAAQLLESLHYQTMARCLL